MDNCKELFLSDIISISVHPVRGCQFPIPFSVQRILSMNNCVLSQPVFEIGNEEEMLLPVEGSLSAKCTSQLQPSGLVCVFDIAATLEEDSAIIRENLPLLINNDHYVCIRTRDSSTFLCYTLPGSFSFSAPSTLQSRQIEITLKANSEFIPITLR